MTKLINEDDGEGVTGNHDDVFDVGGSSGNDIDSETDDSEESKSNSSRSNFLNPSVFLASLS